MKLLPGVILLSLIIPLNQIRFSLKVTALAA